MPDIPLQHDRQSLAPRPLDLVFWLKMGAAALMMAIALYGWIGGAPGHSIYAIAGVIIALAAGARTAAEYTGQRWYRDTYLVLGGLAFGVLLTPLLLRWLAA